MSIGVGYFSTSRAAVLRFSYSLSTKSFVTAGGNGSADDIVTLMTLSFSLLFQIINARVTCKSYIEIIFRNGKLKAVYTRYGKLKCCVLKVVFEDFCLIIHFYLK